MLWPVFRAEPLTDADLRMAPPGESGILADYATGRGDRGTRRAYSPVRPRHPRLRSPGCGSQIPPGAAQRRSNQAHNRLTSRFRTDP